MAIKLYDNVKQEATFWLGRRLPTCEELLLTMSESLERNLTWREKIKMRLHFLICAYCSRYLKHLRIMRQTIRGRAVTCETESSTSALSDVARERLKRALEERG